MVSPSYKLIFFLFVCPAAAVGAMRIWGGAAQKLGNVDKQEYKVKCKIATPHPLWSLGSESPIVTVEIELQGNVKVRALPALSLIALPREAGQRREEYWAPFSLNDGKTTTEWATLTTAEGKGSFGARVLPFDLLWARAKSSVWPSQRFLGTIPPGEYRLRLQLDTGDDKRFLSNEIKVSIQR
jgi:hypothetical protein